VLPQRTRRRRKPLPFSNQSDNRKSFACHFSRVARLITSQYVPPIPPRFQPVSPPRSNNSLNRVGNISITVLSKPHLKWIAEFRKF